MVKEEVTCQLHFAVNIWKAKLQLFALPPITTSPFFLYTYIFVRVPSIFRFSALLKHPHGSVQIELLWGLGFKYIHMYLLV